MPTLRQEQDALLRTIRSLPPDSLPALRRIVEAFADALGQERVRERAAREQEVRLEMAAWDAASDEALAGFERHLADSP